MKKEVSFSSEIGPILSMRMNRLQLTTILILCGNQYVISLDPNVSFYGDAKTDSDSGANSGADPDF